MPGWLRWIVSLVLMTAGTLVFLATKFAEGPRAARGAIAIGLGLIVAGGWILLNEPSESEKKGYHD